MNPSPNDYLSDRRLDILVLGPMGDARNEPSTIKLQSALNALLQEDELQTLLTRHHILTRKVHCAGGAVAAGDRAQHSHAAGLG